MALKVAYYSADDSTLAVARLRFIDPIRLLGANVQAGYGVTRVTFAQAGGSRVENNIEIGYIRDADVIVVQRGFPGPGTREFQDAILSSGKPLVYETDDDLRIVQNESQQGYLECIPYIEKFARAASLVTVSTPYLAERYRPLNPRTLILPNFLPHGIWSPATAAVAKSSILTIGFCGSSTHESDLKLIEDALIEISRRHPVRLLFVGCMTHKLWALPNVSFFEYRGDYLLWPRRLAAAGIDIAVVPLVDNEFNRCKSNIKFLELGYMGIPAIYSRGPAYDTVEDGVTGLLVSADTAAWVEALERLIADSAARKRLAENARREVLSNHLLEEHCGRWLEAYRSLL